ncbi:hypothetical protein DY000_02029245, partial [Brassica cretica]
MDYRRLVSKLMPSWKREAEVKMLGKRYVGPTSDVNSVFGYKIHGHPFSTNTRRVLAVLLEKGLLYEPITVDLKSGEHKSESFLSLSTIQVLTMLLLMQPFGQVPVFEDENVKLFESRAITQYIAYLHSARGTQLLSLESEETLATLTMWMEIEAHQFDPFASRLTWEQVIKPLYGLETDHTVVKENEAGLEQVLNVYEKRLGESRFLACMWVDEITGREAWKMACDQEKSWFGKQRKDDTTGKAFKMPCEQTKSWF